MWEIPGGASRDFVLPGSYGAATDGRGDATRIEVTLTGSKDGNRVVGAPRWCRSCRETLFMRMAIVVGCMGKFDCDARPDLHRGRVRTPPSTPARCPTS